MKDLISKLAKEMEADKEVIASLVKSGKKAVIRGYDDDLMIEVVVGRGNGERRVKKPVQGK